MSLWRRTRSELTGAWRSFRYDLGRRPAEPPAAAGPDVTSTGMSTFGGQTGLDEPVSHVPRDGRRPPRRAVAVSAFGLLTVVGAAGAYLAVVNGLGSLLNEETAAAGTLPPTPAATSESGIGSGPASRRPHARKLPAPAHAPTTAGILARATVPGLTRATATPPTRPAGPTRTKKAVDRECHCAGPPVPTPAAPGFWLSPIPSETPPTSDSPAPGESSATPGESPEPSENRWSRHRKWHH